MDARLGLANGSVFILEVVRWTKKAWSLRDHESVVFSLPQAYLVTEPTTVCPDLKISRASIPCHSPLDVDHDIQT